MEYYVGIDVSLEASSVCAVDASGAIVREGKPASTPAALAAFLRDLPAHPTLIGLEAGPLSQWLHLGLEEAGFKAVLMETRAVKDAFRSRPVKTDRADARGIAQLVRMRWFRVVHRKSPQAQERRALLAARAQLRGSRHATEMTLRGILRNFGLKVGKTTPKSFAARVRDLAAGNAMLESVVAALLVARETLDRECEALTGDVSDIARADARLRNLMTAPGVGPLTAIAFASAIDDPARMGKARNAGPYFGLTPKRYQSGEIDRAGRISKCGDEAVRALLYEAAFVIVTRPVRAGALKSWGLRLVKRIGLKKAVVAVARKLAVILTRMMADNTPFDLTRGAAMA